MREHFGRELVKCISSRDYSEGELDMKPIELLFARPAGAGAAAAKGAAEAAAAPEQQLVGMFGG